jgi:hypothetical protein
MSSSSSLFPVLHGLAYLPKEVAALIEVAFKGDFERQTSDFLAR